MFIFLPPASFIDTTWLVSLKFQYVYISTENELPKLPTSDGLKFQYVYISTCRV